jgi:hypothetical protein
VTIRGGVRGLNARLARLEQHVPEPQGPVVYKVMFHDGVPAVAMTPSYGGQGTPDAGQEIVYRIASWEESELDRTWPGTARHHAPPPGRR